MPRTKIAKPDPNKEAVYSGVRSGPYLKYYQEWLATDEGQRVASTPRPHNGYLDFMLALCTVGVTERDFDKFTKEDH